MPVTPGANSYEGKSTDTTEPRFKLGEDSFEDFPVFSPAPLERPPCRQGETIFDLENSFPNVRLTVENQWIHEACEREA